MLPRGAEGLEGLAGSVEVGTLTEGLAEAITVELAPDRDEDGAQRQVHMVLVNMLDDLEQHRGRGVVDVPDGGAVNDQPVQRAAVSRATANSCFLIAASRRIPMTSTSSTAITNTTAAKAASGR